jgi:hypothetical protein
MDFIRFWDSSQEKWENRESQAIIPFPKIGGHEELIK